MTLKEAVLISLNDLKKPVGYKKVSDHIIAHGYYDFKIAKTPQNTISSVLGDFVRDNDSRVKRIKHKRVYSYYLTKNEQYLELDFQSNTEDKNNYEERSLHKLLSSYLKNTQTYSKTIFHEQSKNGKDANQVWIHPDMIGVKFLSLKTKTTQNLLKSINPIDICKISSYEIKKEINTDADLKKSFFQTVSNSNWANYGYLVAFEFSDSLFDEMERLNRSHGIGLIKLHRNPYKSKILFPSKYKHLDFATVDKLSGLNKGFNDFITQVYNLINAPNDYIEQSEKGFDEFCDEYFQNDSEIEQYCDEKNIPKEE